MLACNALSAVYAGDSPSLVSIHAVGLATISMLLLKRTPLANRQNRRRVPDRRRVLYNFSIDKKAAAATAKQPSAA